LVGQAEKMLKVLVPGGKPQALVKHRHAVGHIVKSHPQLGLALADLG